MVVEQEEEEEDFDFRFATNKHVQKKHSDIYFGSMQNIYYSRGEGRRNDGGAGH